MDYILLGRLQVIGQLGIKILKCIVKINILWKSITQGEAKDLRTFKCSFEGLRLKLCIYIYIYMIAPETGYWVKCLGYHHFPPTVFLLTWALNVHEFGAENRGSDLDNEQSKAQHLNFSWQSLSTTLIIMSNIFKWSGSLSSIDFNWDLKIGFELLQNPSALENSYFSHFIIH